MGGVPSFSALAVRLHYAISLWRPSGLEGGIDRPKAIGYLKASRRSVRDGWFESANRQLVPLVDLAWILE